MRELCDALIKFVTICLAKSGLMRLLALICEKYSQPKKPKKPKS